MNVAGVLSVLVVLAFSVHAQTFTSDSKPKAYSLKLDLSDLGTSNKFNASAQINITVVGDTKTIVMNAANLDINSTSVQLQRKSSISNDWISEVIKNITVDDGRMKIECSEPITATDYILSLNYRGSYQSIMDGFAKVGYLFQKSQRYVGVTNFEPTSARSVFPCYEEPGYRTSFKLEFVVNMTQMVLTSEKPTYVHNISDTKRVFLFDTFPDMPAYRLGWVVIDQNTYRQMTTNASGTEVHTRALYPHSNHTATAHKMTEDLMEAMIKYTNQPYPLDKLEQIVVPEFFIGTTITWGMMCHSEETLLVTPNITSAIDTQKVALILARGIAQQWFGGLVSMDSWDNEWLMKGCAEYYKYRISDSLEDMKEWELRDQMVVETIQPALTLDVAQHALTPNEDSESATVNAVYDDLTTMKGGAIIRMIHHFLGDGVFNTALTAFMRIRAKSATEPKALWSIMYEAARESKVDLALQSVEEIMNGWSNLPGYPMLNVSYDGKKFSISQGSGQWLVPVTYVLQENPRNVTKVWLKPGDTLTINSMSKQWILLNINQTGYYRVNYSSSLREALYQQLMGDLMQIPRLSRAQIIDDVFALSFSGIFSPDLPLNFTTFLKKDTDYYSWHTALRNYRILSDKLYGHSSHKLLQDYVLSLMSNVIDEVGMAAKPQDTHTDKLKRALVLEKACAFGHPACLQKASSILRSWMANTYYNPDLSMALLCAGVSNSSTSVWRSVWDMYHFSSVPSVRANILKALTCSSDVALLKEFLSNITSSSTRIVSRKEKTILLQTLSSTSHGAQVLFNWLLESLCVQMNITDSQESTSTPHSTTPSSTTMTSTTNKPIQKRDTSSGRSSQAQSRESRETPGGKVTSGESAPPTPLSDEDVATIISYVLPKLTHLDNGTKMESLLLNNNTGLSNATVQLIRKAAAQIYKNDEWARKQNGKITAWLEEEAASTTSPPSGPTDKPATSTTSITPTAQPSGAEAIHSSLAVCTLVIVLHYSLML